MKQCLIFIVLVIFSACKNKESIVEKHIDSVQLTTEEIQKSKIQTKKLSQKSFPKSIECSGYIDVPPLNKASVTAPINGFVKTIFFSPGSFVNKGDALAVFEHSDYIKLQEEYLEAKNKLKFYKEEFKRQAELTLENATSIKTYQKAQVDYRSTEVRFLSLKAQLNFIGLNPDKINEDNIQSYINIYAPISGYITKINANIGKYIDSQQCIYEIDDLSTLYLYLKIKEEDIFYLEQDQNIIFNTKTNNREYTANIKFIEQTLDKEEKSINIHAKIDSIDNYLKPGMLVQAKILYENDNVFVIDEKAIINSDKNSYIIVKEGDKFKRKEITTGLSKDGLIEIIDPSKSIQKNDIVVNGTDFINSKLN